MSERLNDGNYRNSRFDTVRVDLFHFLDGISRAHIRKKRLVLTFVIFAYFKIQRSVA